MFAAFLEALEIIVGLLDVTFVFAITKALLLRFLLKQVIILTEVAELTILTTMVVMQEATFKKLCLIFRRWWIDCVILLDLDADNVCHQNHETFNNCHEQQSFHLFLGAYL